MASDPTCPNCGQPMALIAPPKGVHHRFECKNCNVVYMTEDHIPVSGERPAQSNETPAPNP